MARSGDFQIADLSTGGFKPPLPEKAFSLKGNARMRAMFTVVCRISLLKPLLPKVRPNEEAAQGKYGKVAN